MEKTLAVLIAGHCIADFVIRPACMSKNQCGNLLLHLLYGVLHAATAYVLFQSWACWKLPLLLFLTHFLIDFMQECWKDTDTAFAATQFAHLAGIIAIAMLGLPEFTGIGFAAIVLLGGFVATVKGAGLFVGKFTRRLLEENKPKTNGLPSGGKWIGQLERALIFVLIFIGYPGGIGFLVTAKSILRFEESKKQKQAEYVLIGTLMSFTLAIVIATLTKWAITGHMH